MNHEGRVAVVTGGAKGIGRGIVERFAAEGASVVLIDIDEALAREVAAPLGDRALVVKADVTSEADMEAALGAARARFGRVDVMVNNVGIIQVKSLLDSTPEEWRRILDVNVVSVFIGCKVAARHMIELTGQGAQSGGVILNAASGAGRRGNRLVSAYCATKSAIINMTQSFALELAPHKIRVNAYQPGHIETPLWDDLAVAWKAATGQSKDEMIELFKTTVPWGRFGRPDDVAAVCSFLATDDAEYVTGQAVAMNGAEMLF